MITRPNVKRAHKRNPHLARLDRAIQRNGEDLEFRFAVGSSTVTRQRVNLRGIVKTLGIQQVIAGITATQYCIVISPNDLRRAQARSGRLSAAAGTGTRTGHQPFGDLTLPTTSDNLQLRGGQKTITRVDALYSGNECVRIELFCTG